MLCSQFFCAYFEYLNLSPSINKVIAIAGTAKKVPLCKLTSFSKIRHLQRNIKIDMNLFHRKYVTFFIFINYCAFSMDSLFVIPSFLYGYLRPICLNPASSNTI